MKRIMLAGLLAGSCVLTARAPALASDPSYEAAAAIRYVDLDFRGRRGQVQEYDGKLYRGAHGDVSVGNQGTYGLFDLSITDIGSTEENGALNVDHKSGLKASAKYQTMHHRLNFFRVGEILNGIWAPKINIDMRGGAYDELVMRRSESEFNLAFVSPENSARFIAAQYWGVDKVGSRAWSWTGSPNIQAGSVGVDNSKRDVALGLGTNLWGGGALSLDLIRSEFKDNAATLASIADGGTGSSNNGGVIKRSDARQSMSGAEFKFRHDVSKDLALTGAFTGRQRENLRTDYKFNAVVGALNAAYRAGKKLSLLARLYFRAYQVDENLGYFPAALNANAVQYLSVDTHQFDKTTFRGEAVASFRPVDKVKLKAAYKVEINNRRDAPTMVYSANRFFADGTFVAVTNNEVARNDVRHLGTLGAKVELPLGIEVDAEYNKLRANRPAFVNMANLQDDANATLSVPLPKDVSLTLIGGYLQEKNNVTNYTQYSQTRNTYRAGLDWTGSNRASFGGYISYEAIRYFTELYLGSGSATPSATTAFHASTMNRQLNTVYGGHARLILPKGFVVMGNGSYTRSTVTTPLNFRFATGTVNDFTPSNVNIARGSLAVEYTPEKYKNLTARASYAVSDWVDKYDELNSGRASVAQLGASMRF